MEKKRAVGILLLVTCLIIVPTNLFAQAKGVEIENAAVYYSKALDLLKYPTSEEVKNKIVEIAKNGWQKEDKELEKILNENEPVFIEFKKGLHLEKCDFAFGKEYKYLIEKELPPLLKVRNLSNLLALKSRYYEKQKEFNKAINVYLSMLTFAQHISQDNTMMSKMIAIAIESSAYMPIKQYLNSEKSQRNEALMILQYLSDYEKKHFPIRVIVEDEKEFFISTVKMLADETKRRVEEGKELDEKKKKAMEELGEELIKQADELGDRYYGNFAKAAETNKESDWVFAMNEIEALQKSLTSPLTNIKDVSNLLYDAYTRDVEGSRITIARRIIKLMIAIALPNFKRSAENYYKSLKELKEIILLAKTKVAK